MLPRFVTAILWSTKRQRFDITRDTEACGRLSKAERRSRLKSAPWTFRGTQISRDRQNGSSPITCEWSSSRPRPAFDQERSSSESFVPSRNRRRPSESENTDSWEDVGSRWRQPSDDYRSSSDDDYRKARRRPPPVQRPRRNGQRPRSTDYDSNEEDGNGPLVLTNIVPTTYHIGDEVELTVERFTPMGVVCKLDDTRFFGLVHNSDMPVNVNDLRKGDQMTGFIRLIRQDGKVDLMVQRSGLDGLKDARGRLLRALQTSPDGFIPLSDRSSPEEIKALVQMSKNTFKQSCGMLLKEGLLKFIDDGIQLAYD
mmetsp:Transcript_16152/g.26631  ORF Transcript_16152/g.26631 Transcript_16152/m.26631 type:complete len:312 (+) Transcript_16152:158-1093(+)